MNTLPRNYKKNNLKKRKKFWEKMFPYRNTGWITVKCIGRGRQSGMASGVVFSDSSIALLLFFQKLLIKVQYFTIIYKKKSRVSPTPIQQGRGQTLPAPTPSSGLAWGHGGRNTIVHKMIAEFPIFTGIS